MKTREIWEVTVRNCICGACPVAYRERFLGKPDATKLAEAIRAVAAREQAAAEELLATPDAPGSWVGGGPGNGEIAAACTDRAARLLTLADKVDRGQASIGYTHFEVIDTEVIDTETNHA